MSSFVSARIPVGNTQEIRATVNALLMALDVWDDQEGLRVLNEQWGAPAGSVLKYPLPDVSPSCIAKDLQDGGAARLRQTLLSVGGNRVKQDRRVGVCECVFVCM